MRLRHPGAVTLEVAVAAVAQALAVDHAEAEERPQVVAGDEVAAKLLVDDAVQLTVVGVDAAVEHCDRDRPVAGRAAPGGLDVHALVVPLEERVPRVEVHVVAIGERAVAVPVVPQVFAPVGGEERVGEEARDERLRGDARVEARRGGHDRECADRAQVAHDDSAGSGDRPAHLRRRRAGENRTTVTPKGLPAAVADPVIASAAANVARRRVGRITVLQVSTNPSRVLHHPF